MATGKLSLGVLIQHIRHQKKKKKKLWTIHIWWELTKFLCGTSGAAPLAT